MTQSPVTVALKRLPIDPRFYTHVMSHAAAADSQYTMRQRDNSWTTGPSYEQPRNIPVLLSVSLPLSLSLSLSLALSPSTSYLLFIPTCGSILSLLLSMRDSVCGGVRSTDGVPAGKDLAIKADRCSGSWEK